MMATFFKLSSVTLFIWYCHLSSSCQVSESETVARLAVMGKRAASSHGGGRAAKAKAMAPAPPPCAKGSINHEHMAEVSAAFEKIMQ